MRVCPGLMAGQLHQVAAVLAGTLDRPFHHSRPNALSA
jgi:hypothetical protein